MRLSLRLLSSVVQRQPFYITTPIFYVNAEPHIGHLYTAVLADAVQRFEKLTNPHFDIIFSTGTDEHGTKVQSAAAAAGAPLAQYCADISRRYRRLFDEFGVQYSCFVRTSDDRHKQAVSHFWRALRARGHIYKARYSGWYSVPDESFVPHAQLADVTRDGQQVKISLESGHPVEWTEEENYMFRLSAFREPLQRWLSEEGVVVPAKYQAIAQRACAEYLPDISVSRPRARVHWAVPVPDDPTQSVYVWVDALVNYLTATGYPHAGAMAAAGRPWPADLHVVGKDILKFHAVYWPALLLAAGLPPPRRLLAHAHWTRDAAKMSKSRGNVLAPRDVTRRAATTAADDVIARDALRYMLLREATLHDDANFSETKFVNICNSELADSLGNLLSRSLALCPLAHTPPYDASAAPGGPGDVEKDLMDKVERLADECHAHYSNFQLYRAADAAVRCLHAANAYFDAAAPWALRRHNHTARLYSVIHVALETLRVVGIVLQPMIPALSDRLLTKLGVGTDQRLWEHARPQWGAAQRDMPPGKFVLFPRIPKEKDETVKVEKQKKKKKDKA